MIPEENRMTTISHGVTISRSRSKADTQAVLIRGLGLGPTEAAEMSEKFGSQALEAALSKQQG